MIINSSFISRTTGQKWNLRYEELDSFDSIRALPVKAAGAVCFCGDKLVLVFAKNRNAWELPGGGREEGEIFKKCITREIKEESNMKVLELFPLGLETLTNSITKEVVYHIRFAAKVEPYGPFVADQAADQDISDMKLFDLNEYKKYFDWGERGDALVKKAKRLVLG